MKSTIFKIRQNENIMFIYNLGFLVFFLPFYIVMAPFYYIYDYFAWNRMVKESKQQAFLDKFKRLT